MIVQKILISSFELIRAISGASSQYYAPDGCIYYFCEINYNMKVILDP